MSALTHCDGPGCDRTRHENTPRMLCEPPWLQVEQEPERYDFNDRGCLARWAAGER